MGRRLTVDSGSPRPFAQARKVAVLVQGRVARDFAYCVHDTIKRVERRAARRRRTRLRSGKILNRQNAFLIECQIYDRSDRGARVRLLGDVPAPVAMRLYEDYPERLIDAYVIWRKDRELGLCFIQSPASLKISRLQLACLRGRHYATDG
ncbi:hypothetical protein [Methylocella tundrae]|uniref:Type IV pilus assembly protein PilZ n=1 Tax=Methylocella tundrae TaxID=227605 RepID=A0A4U8YW25_METTU|nr:hypothetical protein [Methylocella tundrae]WPP04752.1 hypothetical protein SIN04_02655 [Methylocella tundrae]VFU06958.1 Type IV pilus assembly protein PilZ [Methylocella tundrae]